MTDRPSAALTDRGIVSVTGPDAEKLLQGLVTNDLSPVRPGEAAFAGLLSPQGKIQFDFLAVRTVDGFLLDVLREKAADLAKRLVLYRLRSKVEIEFRPELAVVVGDETPDTASAHYVDPRLAGLGSRAIVAAGSAHAGDEAAYHAYRIALGVPEGGRDYAFGDAFPHEALFDQLHGVSFSKGCYVGQEIVSRMEHRGTARKRIVQAEAAQPLPPDAIEVVAGDVVIGMLGSRAGAQGLALVRLDRAAEFKSKGIALTVAGTPITLRKPAFASFALEPSSANAAGSS